MVVPHLENDLVVNGLVRMFDKKVERESALKINNFTNYHLVVQ